MHCIASINRAGSDARINKVADWTGDSCSLQKKEEEKTRM